MSAPKLSLKQVLERFRSEDIAYVLRELGLPSVGTKSERVSNLAEEAHRVQIKSPLGLLGPAVQQILGIFREDDLKRVCAKLGLGVGVKVEMVAGLAALVAFLVGSAARALLGRSDKK